MSGLVGTYGNIGSGEFVIACTDDKFNGYDAPGWWRSYLLCIHESASSVTLQSYDGAHTIEVGCQGYITLGTPAHRIGEKVRVKKTNKEATIVAVDWHSNRDAFYYTLDYGNRVSTNWFFDDDIEGL